VLLLDPFQVVPQIRLERRRKHRYPILGALAVTDRDLAVSEVDVFYAQAQPLHKAHAGAIEKRQEGAVSPFERRRPDG
jgi:hypothetical protein